MSKPQSPNWSAKNLHAIIKNRQEVMLLAGYHLPQGLLGKNTDSASIPESADQEMTKFLAQKAEAVFDIWVGDALTEAMRVVGGDPDDGAEVEAFHQALREAPFDKYELEGPEGDETKTLSRSITSAKGSSETNRWQHRILLLLRNNLAVRQAVLSQRCTEERSSWILVPNLMHDHAYIYTSRP